MFAAATNLKHKAPLFTPKEFLPPQYLLIIKLQSVVSTVQSIFLRQRLKFILPGLGTLTEFDQRYISLIVVRTKSDHRH
jgi:hypothetical protein